MGSNVWRRDSELEKSSIDWSILLDSSSCSVVQFGETEWCKSCKDTDSFNFMAVLQGETPMISRAHGVDPVAQTPTSMQCLDSKNWFKLKQTISSCVFNLIWELKFAILWQWQFAWKKRLARRSCFLKFFFFENSRISEAITVPASHVGKLRDVTPPGPIVSWFHHWGMADLGFPEHKRCHGDGGDEICKKDGKIYSMCVCFSMLVAIWIQKNEVTFCLLLPWLFRCHRQVVSWNQQAFRPNPSLPQIDALDGVGSSSLSERSLFHRASILNMAFAANNRRLRVVLVVETSWESKVFGKSAISM